MSTGTWPIGQYADVTPSSVERLPVAAPLAAPRRSHARAETLGFDEVYQDNLDFVWRSVRRMGVAAGNVEDVVQDVFVVVLRHLVEFDAARGSVRSWLYGITSRVVHDHRRRYRRKESRVASLELDDEQGERFPSSHPPPCRAAEQAEEVRLLDRLLAELDEDKREVLVLAQLEEMPVPEIAECLGANVNTVYARLRAARREFDQAYARHCAREARRP